MLCNNIKLFPRQQIKNMEDRYHEAEEERINRQVAMEMELEKKQNSLDQAYKDLEKIQKDIVKVSGDSSPGLRGEELWLMNT